MLELLEDRIAPASFQGLDFSGATALSGDGTTVVGGSFRWTAATGPQSLGNETNISATAVSADGSVIVGSSGGNAFRWTASTGVVGLGKLSSGATGVSADGSIVTGQFYDGSQSEMFLWTAAGGLVPEGAMEDLHSTLGGNVTGISGDGTVVVGTYYHVGGVYAYRWTASTGFVALPHLSNGGYAGRANGISADGNVVVGFEYNPGGPGIIYPTVWTTGSNTVATLKDPSGNLVQGEATGVSADGSVVVGSGEFVGSNEPEAFIWDAADGVRSVQSVLVADNLGSALTGWTLTSATSISSDGTTIVGNGIDPQGNSESWIAHLNAPGFVVTTLADSGPGSLHDVLTQVNNDPISNGADQITFASNIQGGTITLLSPLPALTRDQVTITGPITVTDTASGSSVSNSPAGDGLDIVANDDTIQQVAFDEFNGDGISIAGNGNTITGNTLAYNTGNGVTVLSGTGNGIHQDLFYGNTDMPIELGTNGLVPNSPGSPRTGPNDLQNYPIITESAGIVQGYLNSTPNTISFTIEVYAIWQEINSVSGLVIAQGAQPLGQPQSVATDSNGNGILQPFSDPLQLPRLLNPSDLRSVTYAGTASDPNNNTSEFGLALTPAQIRTAYGINSLPTTVDGKPLDGTGQTIAIVVPYNDPTIFADVDAFDEQFGLTYPGPTLYNQYGAAPTFLKVYDQNGNLINNPATTSDVPTDLTGDSEMEATLDIEWAHAIAPGAKIDLIECNVYKDGNAYLINPDGTIGGLSIGIRHGASLPNVSVVSMSLAALEYGAELSLDSADFAQPGVTYLAGSGDTGAPGGYAAFSPNVVAIGGTTLTLNPDGSYSGETGWGYPDSTSPTGWTGSGGGTSKYEPEPGYQLGVQLSGQRTIPDAALIGGTLVAVADSYTPGNTGWVTVDGTSLATPCWAGLSAIVNQGRAAAQGRAFDSSSPTEAPTALYALPTSDFNNNLGGNNGTKLNTTRYNEVAGLGTPKANLLVPDLINMTMLPTRIFRTVPTGSVLLGSFPSGAGGPYSATVNWGDGTSDTSGEANSPLTIVPTGNTIQVFGSHAFANSGLLTVAVILTDSGGAVATHYAAAQVAADVSSSLNVTHTAFVYSRQTHLEGDSLTLTAMNPTTFIGSFDILLTGLPAGVNLAAASVLINGVPQALTIAQDTKGDWYVHVPQSLIKGLSSGKSISISLGFADPTLTLFNFKTETFNDQFDN